ncbi:MAG: hypothetical protein O2917_05970 [Acidobacteria bacterium]|nr:hypothetical protein [Acidobacteriota bacterium]
MKHMVAAALVLMVSGTGWLATQAQSNTRVDDVTVRAREGYVTLTWRPVLAQPLRGLINILLDEQTPPAPIMAAERRMSCS